MLPNYNLGNHRVLAFYIALTKDKIRSEAFWKDFTEHVTRRNGIVHKGRQVTEQEAEASLRAATALVTHVETVITDATTT